LRERARPRAQAARAAAAVGTEAAPVGEKILVVDDEREIADLVELYLRNENYSVCKFYTAREALGYIEATELDLAILDIMLPDASGLDICQKIRERHTYPIIMLTAKDAETDKITGLTLGADDYIAKPFRPLELVARVKAQLRRYNKYGGGAASDGSGIIVHSGLVINGSTHEALLNEKPLALTPTEFSILRILCANKGNVVRSERLFHEIWGDEYFCKNNNTITVHIRHLREKMGDAADRPKYIKTVWGVGYKIEK
jgi:two-component system response regulator VanR